MTIPTISAKRNLATGMPSAYYVGILMAGSNNVFKTSCSFPPNQGEWILAESKRNGDKGVSALLQGLVQAAMDNSLPELGDDRLLEQLVRIVRPERASRFARLWRSQLAALSSEQQELGYTQAEAAGALIETFLDGVEAGTIRPIENRAFAVLPAAPWLELLEAARLEDLPTIQRLLRKFDSSGLAAMYSFPEETRSLVAETPAEYGDSAEARRRAAELRTAADAKRGPTKKPKH